MTKKIISLALSLVSIAVFAQRPTFEYNDVVKKVPTSTGWKVASLNSLLKYEYEAEMFGGAIRHGKDESKGVEVKKQDNSVLVDFHAMKTNIGKSVIVQLTLDPNNIVIAKIYMARSLDLDGNPNHPNSNKIVEYIAEKENQYGYGIRNVIAKPKAPSPIKIKNKNELKKAKDAVMGVMESGATAEDLINMAEESDDASERYHLYRNAFIKQAEAEKLDDATKTLKTLLSQVVGIPEGDVIAMIEKGLGKQLKKAPKIESIYGENKLRIHAKKQIKMGKSGKILKQHLAEAYAVSGDWESALKEFKQAGGELAEAAKEETKAPSMKCAAFWWDYTPSKNYKNTTAFKVHAADIYKELVGKGDLSALELTLAKKRIEMAKEL